MDAPLMSQWGSFLAAALAIGTTWVYFTIKEPENRQPRRYAKTSLFLLAHTLYLLYSIIVSKPENIFETFRLPVNTPADTFRALLIQKSENGSIASHLELLLKRLSSFDMRLLYVRSVLFAPCPTLSRSHPSSFGHDAIARCEWCSSFEDFALFSLPAALLAYLGEAGVIGVGPSI
jgi:hypothetical protein